MTSDPHQPVLSIEAVPTSREAREQLFCGLKVLQTEDPTLVVDSPNPVTGRVILRGIGETQLQIAIERLTAEFDVQAQFGPVQVAYKETITRPAEGEHKHASQSGGRGAYGHVKLRVYPAEPGTGSRFDDGIVGGAIPKRYIPAVQAGVDEMLARGILAGYSMTDLVVGLYDGSYHEVDSSEAAFRTAAAAACRAALQRAAPVLLEPWMRVEIAAPHEYAAGIADNLKARRARFVTEGTRSQTAIVSALAPLSELLGYAAGLRHLTEGRGSVAMTFHNYDVVQQAGEPGDSWAAPVTAPLKPAPKTRDAREAVPEPDEHPRDS